MKPNIFLAYSRRDDHFKNILMDHLKPIQRKASFDIWDDSDITAGKKWDKDIISSLSSADVILFLVSTNFLNSAYAYSADMEKVLMKYKKGRAIVVPVFISNTPANSGLLDLPANGDWRMKIYPKEEEDAMGNVANGIKEIIKRWLADNRSENPNAIEATDAALEETWHSTKLIPGRVSKITKGRIYCECILDEEKGAMETRSFPKDLFAHLKDLADHYPVLLMIQTKPGSYRIDILDGMGKVDLSLFDTEKSLKELIDSGMGQPLNL